MHRNDLLAKLREYKKRHPDEAACADRYIEFVEQNESCFERSHMAGHVTGSAWLVNRAGDEVLLTHHRKLDKWLQFGGHADGHHDVLDVAKRETQEESGLTNFEPVSTELFDIDVHLIPARKQDPEHYHYDARFVFRALGDEPFVVSDESHELAWVKLVDLEKYTTEVSMLRMRDKWLRQRSAEAGVDAPEAADAPTATTEAEGGDDDDFGRDLPVTVAFCLFSLIAGSVVLYRQLPGGDPVYIACGVVAVLIGLAILVFAVVPALRDATTG